jgi:hypothetical protein
MDKTQRGGDPVASDPVDNGSRRKAAGSAGDAPREEGRREQRRWTADCRALEARAFAYLEEIRAARLARNRDADLERGL